MLRGNLLHFLSYLVYTGRIKCPDNYTLYVIAGILTLQIPETSIGSASDTSYRYIESGTTTQIAFTVDGNEHRVTVPAGVTNIDILAVNIRTNAQAQCTFSLGGT